MTATAIASLVGGIVLLLSNFALLVRMYIRVGDYEKWREVVDRHLADSDRHLDPRRDTERWTELTKRLDKMDKKMDNLLSLERGNIKRQQGDSDDA
jgi:hypothetical protein